MNSQQILSDSKFFDAYSRWDDDKNRYETYSESVDRVMSMHEKFYADFLPNIKKYVEEARQAYKDKLVLASQRSLQFGGDQILKHNAKMYNCASTYADRPAVFGEIFYVLLCGCGAGVSILDHFVAKLPKIAERKKKSKVFVIKDSIEGWSDAVDVLMSSFFVGGGKYPEYEGYHVFFDTSNIRPKGSLISGGFKAPGDESLNLSLKRIEHLLQRVLITEEKNTLSPINVGDIICHIADAVLSGGVRRAALSFLFSHDNYEMITAKTGDWYTTNRQRERANNSAVIIRKDISRTDFSHIFKSVKEFGEPGFVFSETLDQCYNPCFEIGMYPQIDGKSGWQTCNLTEINGGMCSDKEIFFKACRAGAILGTLQAGYTDFKFLTETTKRIVEREALLGVSITGWMESPDVLFDEETLKEGAEIVKQVNTELAELININPASRTTTVKPSGTASILLKTSSGIHPAPAPRYIRNAQINRLSEVANLIKKTNPYMVEESASEKNNDYIISYPITSKENSIFSDDITGVDFLKKVSFAQKHWVVNGTNIERCAEPSIRHNVSNSVTVAKNDWDAVEEYLYENRNDFAGVSFLPDSGHMAYNQAPEQAVLTQSQIIEKYGSGGLFTSGLITDSLDAFGGLWQAIEHVKFENEDFGESKRADAKSSWVRQFKKFAETFMGDDLQLAEECLKDVYLLYRFQKISKNFKPIEWETELKKKDFVDIDTLGAVACAGGLCEAVFN